MSVRVALDEIHRQANRARAQARSSRRESAVREIDNLEELAISAVASAVPETPAPACTSEETDMNARGRFEEIRNVVEADRHPEWAYDNRIEMFELRFDAIAAAAAQALRELGRESESIGPWPSGALRAAILDIERAQRAEHLDRVAGVIEGQLDLIDRDTTVDQWVRITAELVAEELRKP